MSSPEAQPNPAGSPAADPSPTDPARFQVQVDRIAQVIGPELTDRMMRAYGGCRLYVPSQPDKTHPIARVIGIEAARLMADRFRGERIDVPKGYAQKIDERNRMIRAERARGLSMRDLARKFDLTERRVRSILQSDEDKA